MELVNWHDSTDTHGKGSQTPLLFDCVGFSPVGKFNRFCLYTNPGIQDNGRQRSGGIDPILRHKAIRWQM